MRVLLTGGAGFIGLHVGQVLRQSGYEVVALDALHPYAHHALQMPDGVALGDIRDADVVASALRGVDLVVHQAALVGLGVDLDDLPEYVSCNDFGTAVLLAGMARAGVRRLVLASSMVVYGEGGYRCVAHAGVRPATRTRADLDAGRFEPRCPECGRALEPALVDEEAPLRPRSVYAATKVAQEHLADAWARETGGVCIALRYHNVYGPGMPRDTPYSGVAAIFRSSVERHEPPRVFEDGRQLRDFVHVSDVARANLAAANRLADLDDGRLQFRAFNVASGEPHTVGELADALSEALDGPRPVVTGGYRAGDVRHIVASPARARAELGFGAETVFHSGVKDFAVAPLRPAPDSSPAVPRSTAVPRPHAGPRPSANRPRPR